MYHFRSYRTNMHTRGQDQTNSNQTLCANNLALDLLLLLPLLTCSHHVLYFVPNKKITVALLQNFVAWVCAGRSAGHAHNNFALELLRISPLPAYSHHILYFVPLNKNLVLMWADQTSTHTPIR